MGTITCTCGKEIVDCTKEQFDNHCARCQRAPSKDSMSRIQKRKVEVIHVDKEFVAGSDTTSQARRIDDAEKSFSNQKQSTPVVSADQTEEPEEYAYHRYAGFCGNSHINAKGKWIIEEERYESIAAGFDRIERLNGGCSNQTSDSG